MGSKLVGMRRVSRFSFDLRAQGQVIPADLIVLGAGASCNLQELDRALDLLEPGAFHVEPIPEDAVLAGIAIRRSLLAATSVQELLPALVAALLPRMDPELIWIGRLQVRLEGEAAMEATDMPEADTEELEQDNNGG